MRDNPNRQPQLDKLLNIRISVAQHRALHDAARRHKITTARLIRSAIGNQISRLDRQEEENAAA